jgi:phosphate transport system protein
MVHFEHELNELKQDLLVMASHADTALSEAMKSLVERDGNLARKVQQDDQLIDRLEIEIDEKAVNLLSKAPLASQLRLITVAMKASVDLERVGDEATTIARRAIQLNEEPQLQPYVDISRMAGMALAMLRDAIQAFVHGDMEKARAVIPRDKEVDQLNKQVHRELTGLMMEDPSVIRRALNLMVISKSLERVADHAKNIAEEAVFLFEGLDIRHPGPALDGGSQPPGF